MPSSLRLIFGILLPPVLVLAAILLVPATLGQWLGVTLRSWCLFACAPITSLLLLLCLRKGGGR